MVITYTEIGNHVAHRRTVSAAAMDHFAGAPYGDGRGKAPFASHGKTAPQRTQNLRCGASNLAAFGARLSPGLHGA